jgi:hypothetical protein
MNARTPIPHPIEIDPNPCGLCGRTVDQHEMIDSGEGPEFLCFDDSGAADLVRQWEAADPRDRWKCTGEPRPPVAEVVVPLVRYRTPQSTVDAFFYMVRLADGEKLRAWLRNHPRDAAFLLKLWKDKNAR